MKTKSSAPSEQTKLEAERLTKQNQKPGQSKQQAKLIEQGIQKGIEQYKKAQKAKAREFDKNKKKQLKAKQADIVDTTPEQSTSTPIAKYLPWLLLVISWLFFITKELY